MKKLIVLMLIVAFSACSKEGAEPNCWELYCYECTKEVTIDYTTRFYDYSFENVTECDMYKFEKINTYIEGNKEAITQCNKVPCK